MNNTFRHLYRRLLIFLKFTLGLTRRERIGLLIIYPIGISLILLTTWQETEPLPENEAESLEYSVLLLRDSTDHMQLSRRRELEPFDPDTISASQMAAYGLPKSLIKAWVNYREKAGGFSYAGQIQNLFPMTDSIYEVVKPYIRLGEQSVKTSFVPVKQPAHQRQKLDINLADTLLWRSLRGIGPVLSRRIVKYRNLLGGFVNPEQLKEVYGIDTILYNKIASLLYVTTPVAIKKIDLTLCSYADLRAHPYISPRQASAIIRYRSQHSELTSTNDLFDIELIDSATINRIRPYILEPEPGTDK